MIVFTKGVLKTVSNATQKFVITKYKCTHTHTHYVSLISLIESHWLVFAEYLKKKKLLTLDSLLVVESINS